MQRLSARLGRAGDLGQPFLHEGPFHAQFSQSIFLNTELLVERGEVMFYHMDDFWPLQRSLFGTDCTKSLPWKWAGAHSDLSHDAVAGLWGLAQIPYTSFTASYLFLKEKDVF